MYREMQNGDMLQAVGDDASKWAAAFMEILGDRLAAIDEGLMIGWFANAIEHSCDVRERRNEQARLGYLALAGYVLVPDEPTDEMLRAGGERSGWTGMAGPVYRAMIEAAPALGGGEAGAQGTGSEEP